LRNSNKILIVGAGITGLSTAFWLKKAGVSFDLLEMSAGAGGNIQTVSKNGYLFDEGPNTALETTPFIRELVDGCAIGSLFTYANTTSKNRYILKNSKLHPLPSGVLGFIRTPLFSAQAKLRLLKEPFIPQWNSDQEESIAGFVKRRLGNEILDYAVNPFISGVSAGNPEKLSVKEAFPKLKALEENYGSLIKGAILGGRERKKRNEESKQTAAMFSFKTGLAVLTDALANYCGEDIQFKTQVKEIVKDQDGYSVTSIKGGIERLNNYQTILLTVPAYLAADIILKLDPSLADKLKAVIYPPVYVLYLGYSREDIGFPLDGFGFLVPEKERRQFLGAIWTSAIFPDRSPSGKAAFTLFIGGAKSKLKNKEDFDRAVPEVIREFQQVMQITGKPELVLERFWPKAIPQYNLGYPDLLQSIEGFESNHQGIILGGNYRGGISLSDCIKNAKRYSKTIHKTTES
jgi:oxygen-dependent protoporphyrinogen oxidase